MSIYTIIFRKIHSKVLLRFPLRYLQTFWCCKFVLATIACFFFVFWYVTIVLDTLEYQVTGSLVLNVQYYQVPQVPVIRSSLSSVVWQLKTKKPTGFGGLGFSKICSFK